MNRKPSIKVIKNGKHKAPEIQTEVERADDPKRWSTAVRLWVVEFQQHRHGEPLPAFDSLFKDALS